MENRIYEFTGETKINSVGVTLKRIRLIIDCKFGKKDDLGGWIEKEENLKDEAWVAENAEVFNNARVYGNALIEDTARVYGNARVCGNSRIGVDACVFENAYIYGFAEIYGNAKIYGNARVCGTAQIRENAVIYDDAQIYDAARIFGNAHISGTARVCGEACVYGSNTAIYGDTKIYDISVDQSPVQIYGSKHFVSIFKNGHVQIGCQGHHINFWKTKYETLGKNNEYSEQEIQEYKLYIDLAVKILKLYKKKQDS